MGKIRSQPRENSIQKDENHVKPLSYFSLFRYSTKNEKCYIALAIILSILSGCIPPVVNILYGEFCNLMIDRQFPTNSSSTETHLMPWFGGGRILRNASQSERTKALIEDSRAWGIGCAVFSFIQFLFSMISVYLLSVTASRQVSRIKILFFKSLLCKDLAWFDTKMTGNFAGQTSENLDSAEKCIGDVLAIIIFQLTIAIVNVLISFLCGWLLSLVLILFVIPICISSFLKEKAQSKLAVGEMSSYTEAGRVAEEVFTSIRTVTAFEGESKEVRRYAKLIGKSQLYGIKRGIVSGLSNGVSWFVIYCCYAVASAYGVRLIQKSTENGDHVYTPGVLVIIFFSIVTALTNLEFASTHLETFAVARGAAAVVFEVINTKTKINPCSEDGIEGEACRGEIEFTNVHFAYPVRPSVHILKGVNLNIKAGEVVAIVGGSGAGKSTVLQLVQRLYDPTQGDVFLDGQNLKSLKVSWLRQQLGVVSQEPLLFSTTIRENILYGNSSASDEEVEEAAKKANAHNFIIKLKDGYNTIVGQKGSSLSGGQRQRIAIARALIRNPKILILDEATSALDANSEVIVQAALDKASEGRTTLIVTHKLSKIVNAHRIIVLADGVVAESGTHEELLAGGGIYKRLLETQEDNIREKKQPKEVRPTKLSHEDNTILPVDPRIRFASRASLPRVPKRYSEESPMQYRSASCVELLSWSRHEWLFMVTGILASLIGGAGIPVVCVLFGYLLGILSLTDFGYIIRKTDEYTLILILIGLVSGVCVFVQMYCFSALGMRLTTRLRIRAFHCMIYQDIGYFDDEKNKVGALCLRLSQDPSEIQATMGVWLGIFLQALSSMVIGVVLSFFLDWKLSLVALATIPFVFTGVYVESAFVQKIFDSLSSEKASTIAVEVISNMRAVASLGKESFFTEMYATAVREEIRKYMKRKAWLTGFAFAIGQTAPFFGYAITLWYGGLLIANENHHYKYIVMVSELLIFGAWTLGQSVIRGPSIGKTKLAAGRLKYIFTREPKVVDGEFRSPPHLAKDGFISYSKVYFAYPTRPGINVLEDFNLRIKAGESVAVMGPSGSGKSTVIQLLLRFYDPKFGTVSINDVDIKTYKLSALRRQLGLVSQEPVLFERTIHENIAYGDNSRVVSSGEVVEAAKSANIHSFIMSLPMGYDTQLGAAGAQLSGGQKQRIAIARALVRNPEILLLDEATSALDPESENVVQDALDKASEKRTTITVAHRFGAVRNADIIHVVENGVIKESGTHETLMELRGLYYSMHEGEDQTNMADGSEK